VEESCGIVPGSAEDTSAEGSHDGLQLSEIARNGDGKSALRSFRERLQRFLQRPDLGREVIEKRSLEIL
jgi:hypothetical protein